MEEESGIEWIIDKIKMQSREAIEYILEGSFALLPLEIFIVYLLTLPHTVGATEMFDRISFIVFYMFIIIVINILYIYIIVFSLYDYYKHLKNKKFDVENKKYWEEHPINKKDKQLEGNNK